MNEYTENLNSCSMESPSVAEPQISEPKVTKQRGRPKQSIVWPDGRFTFDSLKETNVLSASSLRKKMRAELVKGGILKVDTLKTAFGRPLNVYERNK